MGLQDVLDEVEAPGVLASVVTASGEAWHGASGAVAAGTAFRCASVTKTFVAAAVLCLQGSGLDLDCPVAQCLPWYAPSLRSAGYDVQAMTVRHLLFHTSGLPDYASDEAYFRAVVADPGHVWTREEQVAWSLERQAKVGEPGEQLGYSDTGYVLLGALLEERTGTDLDAALRTLLAFDELGLEHTWLETFGPAVPRAPQWVGDVDTSAFHPSMDLWGGGGLVTTTADLVTFFRALLDGRVVPDLPAMLTPQVPNDLGMAAGIFALPLGDSWWGHTGFWNTCAAAQRGSRAAVAVAVLQREAELAPAVAARLVSAAALPAR